MDKAKKIEIATKLLKGIQKIEDFVSQLFDLSYKSLIAQRRIYLQSKKNTTVPVFIKESIFRLSNKKNQVWNKRKESKLYHYQNEYDQLILIFRTRYDLIIKYFDKPEFNYESMRNLISEFKSTTEDFCELTYPHNSNSQVKSSNIGSVKSKVKSFKESLSNTEILNRIEQYVKNPVNKIGKQQLARICYFLLKLGLVKPLDKSHKKILSACNNTLSLRGTLALKKSGIYFDPLDENGGRELKKNRDNTAKLILIFEEIGWIEGVDLVKKTLKK